MKKNIAFIILVMLISLMSCDTTKHYTMKVSVDRDPVENETIIADYGLFVNEGENVIRTLAGSAAGFTVNPEVEVNLPGIAWCGTTRTLILNDFSFETSAGVGLYLPSNSTIELIGTNNIKGTFVGGRAVSPNDICTILASNLTIQGNGTLTATSNYNGIMGYGDITISGATVNAHGASREAGSAGITAFGSDGRFIIRNGAIVTSTSGAIGIRTRRGINVQNGTVTMTGNDRAILVSQDARGFATIHGNFAIPSGIMYWVNNAPVAPNPLGAGTRSNGNIEITASHRYLRLHR